MDSLLGSVAVAAIPIEIKLSSAACSVIFKCFLV